MLHYFRPFNVDFEPVCLSRPPRSRLEGVLPISCGQTGILLAAADFCLVIVLNVVAQAICHPVMTAHLDASHSNLVMSLTAILYCLFMEVQDQYSCASSGAEKGAERVVLRPLLSWLAVFVTMICVVFFAKVGTDVSRLMIIWLFVAGLVALPLGRKATLSIIAFMLDRNMFAVKKRAVVLSLAAASFDAQQISSLQRRGKSIVSCLAVDQFDDASICRLKSLFSRERIDEIFFCCPLDTTVLDDVAAVLKAFPLPVFWLADEACSALLAKPSESIGSMTALKLQGGPLTASQQLAKRVLDVCLSSAGMILLLPIFLFIALAIKLDTKGPVIFAQQRSGFNGRTFRIFKFRSMTTTDDGLHIQQATRNDPRITRVGGYLRKLSLDELPQLFNVLKGEMSLVGPRPHALCHDDQYGESIASYAMRYHVKPGITGWAQVNGCRGETKTVEDMVRRVDLDIWYIKNWSVWIDVRAIFGTVKQLAGTPNAY